MKVDAHQHYWHPARGDYGWMPADDPVLSRPYHPADLAGALSAAGIDRTVLVQAAPTLAETEYLLGIADCTPSVAGVVGWVDFEDRAAIAQLERLAQHPRLLGVRPMIQDIPDPVWMLRDDVQWAFAALCTLDLTFDALGFPQHLDNFLTIAQRYPTLRLVLDHGIKPQIRAHSPARLDQWAEGMRRLASQTSAFCKLSGLLTECDADWSDARLKPYVDVILEAFGAQRVMWGSDWPVVRLRCEYDQWLTQAGRLTAHLSAADRVAIFGGSAQVFYRIGETNS